MRIDSNQVINVNMIHDHWEVKHLMVFPSYTVSPAMTYVIKFTIGKVHVFKMFVKIPPTSQIV